ncbi:glycine cleavage system P protein, mitochondrial [Pelomyxa schiedti]|nr:glycine cleavage system P protein, mitochondrial [Pelomyxa schiedti]
MLGLVSQLQQVRCSPLMMATARSASSTTACCTTTSACSVLRPQDQFETRHLGPREADITEMVKTINASSSNLPKPLKTLDDLIDVTVPAHIRLPKDLAISSAKSESQALAELKEIASKNKHTMHSFIGQGYYNCHVPTVILRNVLENPAWYTPYTPYQAEISQGRLEAMMNFQTVISDLTGLKVPTCSLLDEATAAAEAMNMSFNLVKRGTKNVYFVDKNVHPQIIDVIKTRAAPIGVKVIVGDWKELEIGNDLCGAMVQYPNTQGTVEDYSLFASKLHKKGAVLVCGTDLLALTVLRAPADFGADIAIGSAGRFGAPVGFGGPHAGFLVTKDELKRSMPGRIIGLSKDAMGAGALRMALQTREQHIRREKATSNICTAAALLCDMAGFYAVYHGPEGLINIAKSVHAKTALLADGLKRIGVEVLPGVYFDTLHIPLSSTVEAKAVLERAKCKGINLRDCGDAIGVSFDETTTMDDVTAILESFAGGKIPFTWQQLVQENGVCTDVAPPHSRASKFLQQEVFNINHSEHEMLRYLYRLQLKDVGLTQHCIPLGSCTMKLNSTSEMIPITWPEFASVHPFAPGEQTSGYAELTEQLEHDLAEITGFAKCSLQPNSGAAGEYAGLLTIRNYLNAQGQQHRNVCLIPVSAHGTNPASSAMAGFHIVIVNCLKDGSIDLKDLAEKAKANADNLACMMVTYPSTYGVYEEGIKEIIKIVHANGGLVYMDGANMNAQVGITSPGSMGADVCHLNLHKTFAMPHGGGGPGMGPICCTAKLAPFLPGHGTVHQAHRTGGPVSASPYGSGSILPISWMYIKMLGAKGVKKASEVAILNANYMAARLKEHYPVVFTGPTGMVAHEFIMDVRQFKATAGIEAQDIAKRLMDFGFHGPTMSFPVPNTLMIEPTESESKEELDRLCDALIVIRKEIQDIIDGVADKEDNPLRNAPHTAEEVASSKWEHKYTREQAAFPAEWVRHNKYWVPVKRIDNTWGDMNLCCVLPRADE